MLNSLIYMSQQSLFHSSSEISGTYMSPWYNAICWQ